MTATLFKRLLLATLVASFVWGASQPAQAAGFFGGDPDRKPSVLTYAWRGMGVGAAVGVSAAYLGARRDGWVRDDWRTLGYGAGFGALGGVALGLGLGFVDLADDSPGMAAIVLRDTALGAGLGAAIGLISGGLAILGNDDPESLALGTSIGVIGGTALGLAIGFIEGSRITDSPAHRSTRTRVMPMLSAMRDGGDRLRPVVGLTGSFR